MIFLGHIGIGKRMARPWSENLPIPWLVLGTILPDLIDKPLYYGLVFMTNRHGEDLGLISGTRTFGHTLLLVLVASLIACRGSSKAKALAIGLATHLFLDFLGDMFEAGHSSAFLAAFFPLSGGRFYVSPFSSLKDHLAAKLNWYTAAGEIIGGLLLLQDWLGKKSFSLRGTPAAGLPRREVL